MASSPKNIHENPEDCDELDEDYFTIIGQTFSVVDVWNENDDSEPRKKVIDEDSRSSSKKSDSKIKESASSSSSKRNSSKPRDDHPERRDRSSNRSPDRSRFGSERNRNNEWNRQREIDRDRRLRRPSPPPERRRSISPYRRKNNANSFLLELQETFSKQGKVDKDIENCIQRGMRIDWKTVTEKPDLSQNQMNNPYMNNEPVMPHFNPAMLSQMQGINPVMQQNMMNPDMARFQMGFPMDIYQNPMPQQIPQPVPPPQINVNRLQSGFHQSSISPPIRYNNGNNNQSTITIRENAEAPPRRKTPNQGALNLTELLRQKSKKNQISSEGIGSLTKTRVLERCKEALNLISDLEKNKSKIPLTCILSPSELGMLQIQSDRSPILMNENNPKYMFQATKEQSFSTLDNHPLKNIYGPTAELAQYLKFDLHDLSKTVALKTFTTRKEEPKVLIPPVPPTIHPAVPAPPSFKKVYTKTIAKSVQTDDFECNNCTMREMAKQNVKNKVSQTDSKECVDAEVQYENDEEGGFSFCINAATMANRNFEQHHALKVFSRAFGIECPLFSEGSERSMERRQHAESPDDRMNFANPENPNQMAADEHLDDRENADFISISPIRSNFKRSMSSQRIRPHIFDRIGDKVSDHSDSPKNYDELRINFQERPSFRPYTIPSPEYSERYERSPGPSRRYRNRSRSRSRSRGRRNRSRSYSRSPRRFRDDNRLNNRRGRY